MKKHTLFFFLLISGFILGGCGNKAKQQTAPTPTPTPRLIELETKDRPTLSLVPREDGHELKLTITDIPKTVSQIEYELIYSASGDGITTIEKGLGDVIQYDGNQVVRDLLLGTSSCTNGCKYKYDEGVTGGSLSLKFILTNGQIALFETPWSIASDKQITKNDLSLGSDIRIQATSLSPGFYLILQDYRIPENYLVFSSGKGLAKGLTITPNSITKTDLSTLTGTYTSPIPQN